MCKKSTACDCTWSPMEDECHIKRVGELVPAIPPGLHAQISSGCHHCAPPHPHLIQYTGADLIFQALCLEAFMLQPMGFSGRHTKSHGPGKDGVETGLERTKAKLWWGVVGNCRKLA